MLSYLALFLLLIGSASAAKILVFSPTISRSHMISNGRIADELALAGHDVVLFEPDFLNIFESVQAAKVAKRWPVKGFGDQLLKVLSNLSMDIFQDCTILELINLETAYHAAYNSMCRQIIENDQLMNQLRAEKFDAYFGEQINLCGNGLAHALDIKIHFWISSCPIFESTASVTGMPTPLSYIPAGGMSFFSDPSYFDRATNLVYGTANFLLNYYAHYKTSQIFKDKFGENFPNVGEIAGNSDIIFVASDEFVEISRPEMPNMVHIGGLGLGKEKKLNLDKTFQKELSLGKDGIVYFSLGTIVNTTLLPPSVMENLAIVAKTLSTYHFILRVDQYDLHAQKVAKSVPNLSVHAWVPQVGILNHPRLKAFITHSGYNGIMEAARAGVPLLTIPFMFDQAKNSQAVTQNGWGVALHRRTLRDKPEEVVKTLRELLTNEKYTKAAQRIQRLILEKPFNATERLIKTTNFVLSNGGVKELLSIGRKHSFIHYYNLDIILPFVFIILGLFYAILRVFLNLCCGQKRRVKVKTN